MEALEENENLSKEIGMKYIRLGEEKEKEK